MASRRVMTIANTDIPTLDSREVAPMIDMRHSDLLRNIAHYEEVLTERKIALSDFFIKSEYKDASGKANKCYLLTKMGCEMVANKLTGKKGILFTAEYVKRFNEMEKQHLEEMPSYMIEDPVERARRWADEMEAQDGRIRTLQGINAKQTQMIGELKPKADYVDRILRSKETVLISVIAKDYGMSAKAMNKLLHEMKIVYPMGGTWLLYSKHQSKGYTHSKTIEFTHRDGRQDFKLNTEWTQKGRLFLYKFLKKKGILPVIERDVDKEAG